MPLGRRAARRGQGLGRCGWWTKRLRLRARRACKCHPHPIKEDEGLEGESWSQGGAGEDHERRYREEQGLEAVRRYRGSPRAEALDPFSSKADEGLKGA